MQIWYPGPHVQDDGDYDVELNPGSRNEPFAIINLGGHIGGAGTALVIQDLEEAQRLLRAARKAERMLSEAKAAQRPDDADGGA